MKKVLFVVLFWAAACVYGQKQDRFELTAETLSLFGQYSADFLQKELKAIQNIRQTAPAQPINWVNYYLAAYHLRKMGLAAPRPESVLAEMKNLPPEFRSSAHVFELSFLESIGQADPQTARMRLQIALRNRWSVSDAALEYLRLLDQLGDSVSIKKFDKNHGEAVYWSVAEEQLCAFLLNALPSKALLFTAAQPVLQRLLAMQLRKGRRADAVIINAQQAAIDTLYLHRKLRAAGFQNVVGLTLPKLFAQNKAGQEIRKPFSERIFWTADLTALPEKAPREKFYAVGLACQWSETPLAADVVLKQNFETHFPKTFALPGDQNELPAYETPPSFYQLYLPCWGRLYGRYTQPADAETRKRLKSWGLRVAQLYKQEAAAAQWFGQ